MANLGKSKVSCVTRCFSLLEILGKKVIGVGKSYKICAEMGKWTSVELRSSSSWSAHALSVVKISLPLSVISFTSIISKADINNATEINILTNFLIAC